MNDLIPLPVSSSSRRPAGRTVAPGSWWRLKDEWNGMAAGTILLCTEVNVADGFVHSVELDEPPSRRSDEKLSGGWGSVGWTMLVEELDQIFERATQQEALASRDREIAELQSGMAELQDQAATAQSALLAIGSSASKEAPALSGPRESVDGEAAPGASTALAGTDGALTAARAQAVRNDALASSAAIAGVVEKLTASTKAMERKSARLALYFGERSKAALASIKPAIAVAARLQERVDTMGLYIGMGVHAELLVDGPSAAASEKLHILQRRLHMDEELLIHVESGGADYTDQKSLASALASDPTLVRRIFGCERCVVSAAWRRRDKDYQSGRFGKKLSDILASLMEAAQENAENKATFLLVRDGGRIWKVDLPGILRDLDRMFPTPSDMEAPYTVRGWFSEPPRRIGLDDLQYAKATEEFRKLALHYERVLIVLWGLHDRLGIFGPFMENSPYENFIDPRMQQERFRLVWDDQNLIGPGRPSYRDWFKERNKALRSGSRVMVRWRIAMTPKSAPGAVEESDAKYTNSGSGSRFRYAPDESFGLAVVRREADHMIVDCPVSGKVWRGYEEHVRRFMARVDLTIASDDDRFSFLVLDDVDPADIDFYLESRSQRPGYLDYVALLVAARNAVASDLEKEAAAHSELMAAAASAGLDAPEGGWRRAIREIVRDWRADNRGRPLPAVDAEEWPAVRGRLLAKMWFAVSTDTDRELADRLASEAAETGRRMVRLSRDGRNRLVSYARAVDDGMVERLGEWPFLERSVLSVGRNGRVRVERSSETWVTPALVSAETVVREYEKMTFGPGFKDFRKGAALREAVAEFESLARKPSAVTMASPDADTLEDVLTHSVRLSRDSSSHTVRRPLLFHPFGLVVKKPGSFSVEAEVVTVAGYAEDAWAWVARKGGPSMLERVRTTIGRFYRTPDAALSALDVQLEKPVMQFAECPLAGGVERLRPGTPSDVLFLLDDRHWGVLHYLSPATPWNHSRDKGDIRDMADACDVMRSSFTRDRSPFSGKKHCWEFPGVERHLRNIPVVHDAVDPEAEPTDEGSAPKP